MDLVRGFVSGSLEVRSDSTELDLLFLTSPRERYFDSFSSDYQPFQRKKDLCGCVSPSRVDFRPNFHRDHLHHHPNSHLISFPIINRSLSYPPISIPFYSFDLTYRLCFHSNSISPFPIIVFVVALDFEFFLYLSKSIHVHYENSPLN